MRIIDSCLTKCFRRIACVALLVVAICTPCISFATLETDVASIKVSAQSIDDAAWELWQFVSDTYSLIYDYYAFFTDGNETLFELTQQLLDTAADIDTKIDEFNAMQSSIATNSFVMVESILRIDDLVGDCFDKVQEIDTTLDAMSLDVTVIKNNILSLFSVLSNFYNEWSSYKAQVLGQLSLISSYVHTISTNQVNMSNVLNQLFDSVAQESHWGGATYNLIEQILSQLGGGSNVVSNVDFSYFNGWRDYALREYINNLNIYPFRSQYYTSFKNSVWNIPYGVYTYYNNSNGGFHNTLNLPGITNKDYFSGYSDYIKNQQALAIANNSLLANLSRRAVNPSLIPLSAFTNTYKKITNLKKFKDGIAWDIDASDKTITIPAHTNFYEFAYDAIRNALTMQGEQISLLSLIYTALNTNVVDNVDRVNDLLNSADEVEDNFEDIENSVDSFNNFGSKIPSSYKSSPQIVKNFASYNRSPSAFTLSLQSFSLGEGANSQTLAIVSDLSSYSSLFSGCRNFAMFVYWGLIFLLCIKFFEIACRVIMSLFDKFISSLVTSSDKT